MLLVIYQNKIQQRAERNNFPLHNHRVTKLSRVASKHATLEFFLTGILTVYTVLLTKTASEVVEANKRENCKVELTL